MLGRIEKNRYTSARNDGRGGIGMLIAKAIRALRDNKGEDIKRPRNITISRVWNIWLICPTMKNSRGDEIP